jgi:hypothetical protein
MWRLDPGLQRDSEVADRHAARWVAAYNAADAGGGRPLGFEIEYGEPAQRRDHPPGDTPTSKLIVMRR